ncbi:leucyl aminopeptidase family protein [Neokomagataea thailandica]|uniref:Leucyl aminopeptidase n=1 Tax=Neokomagataea tanensis NBRC 106556 TaxID=1223519 RepID=A0ABQ0QG09_9PROT|nr:leucyl aminopeptidase [Neokomagataea tanensis NBRC 106556]
MISVQTLPFIAASALNAEDGSVKTLHIVAPSHCAAFEERYEAWLKAQAFQAKAGQYARLPEGAALFVVSPEKAEDPSVYGVLGTALDAGDWRIACDGVAEESRSAVVLGFAMGAYRYHVRGRDAFVARLVVDERDAGALAFAEANRLGRDLINTPANLLGPVELAAQAREALVARGAAVDIVQGEALRTAYPCLAAVGEGSDRPSQVVIGRWQKREGAPLVSLVGKGVCFDTGGYDLKPPAGMLRMKKDMGGAALALAVACTVIDLGLDVSLEVRLGCVENSVSGHAMRPGDVLMTRSGKTVEVGNTDAEGRLVMCDLLTEASEHAPAWLLDMATLTGAARVALGPDLPALFTNDDNVAEIFCESAKTSADPLWRMPLWHGYDAWLDSKIADMGNITAKPMAGAITAALYLQRFVPKGQKWCHIDTYAWNDASTPGRPEGGETLGLRAIVGAIAKLC